MPSFYVRVLERSGDVLDAGLVDADDPPHAASRSAVAQGARAGATIEVWPLDGEPYRAHVVVSAFAREVSPNV